MGEVLLDHDLGSQHNGVPQRNPKRQLQKETLLLLFISLHLLLVFMFLCFFSNFAIVFLKLFLAKINLLSSLGLSAVRSNLRWIWQAQGPSFPQKVGKKNPNKTKPQKRPPSNLSDRVFWGQKNLRDKCSLLSTNQRLLQASSHFQVATSLTKEICPEPETLYWGNDFQLRKRKPGNYLCFSSRTRTTSPRPRKPQQQHPVINAVFYLKHKFSFKL